MTVPPCFSFSIQLAGVALTAMLLLGAHGRNATNDAKAVQRAVDPNLMVAQPTLVQHLKVVPVGKQPVAERLRVPGQIAFNEQHVMRISATVTGRVIELVAMPGQSAKTGGILTQLHSTELNTVQLAYQKTAAQHDLQAHALERAKLLLAADVINSAGLQRRRSELAIADAEVRAAVNQLHVVDVSPDALAEIRTSDMSSVSSMVTSISSTVVERKVTRGQVVQPADKLFTMADLSRVWVVGEVPGSAAAGVRAEQAVEIDTGADDRIVGKLIWVPDIIDPQARTVTVRIEMDNAERTLKSSMLTTLLIQSRPEGRVIVPTSAVVHEGNRNYAFVHTSETNYQFTPIKLSGKSDGVRSIISGMQAGQPIVVEGGFHLNDEHKRAEMEGT